MSLCSQQQGLGVSSAFQSQSIGYEQQEQRSLYSRDDYFTDRYKLPASSPDFQPHHTLPEVDYTADYISRKYIKGGTYSFGDPIESTPKIYTYDPPLSSKYTLEDTRYETLDLTPARDYVVDTSYIPRTLPCTLDNIRPDRAHAGKPEHIDFTRRLLDIGGADKVEVNYCGDIIGGSTYVGKTKMYWED